MEEDYEEDVKTQETAMKGSLKRRKKLERDTDDDDEEWGKKKKTSTRKKNRLNKNKRDSSEDEVYDDVEEENIGWNKIKGISKSSNEIENDRILGPDLFYDEEDRRKLMELPEIEREKILFQRSEEQQALLERKELARKLEAIESENTRSIQKRLPTNKKSDRLVSLQQLKLRRQRIKNKEDGIVNKPSRLTNSGDKLENDYLHINTDSDEEYHESSEEDDDKGHETSDEEYQLRPTRSTESVSLGREEETTDAQVR
jgi:RNA polymerase-associated protein RTF1